jgi:hypothetical protein
MDYHARRIAELEDEVRSLRARLEEVEAAYRDLADSKLVLTRRLPHR